MESLGHLQLVAGSPSKEHVMLTSSLSVLQSNIVMNVSNAWTQRSPTGGVGDGVGDGEGVVAVE